MPGRKYDITDGVLDALERGRIRKGLTEAELYKKAGVSKQLYSQIKNRVNKSSSKIADLLAAVDEPVDIAESWRSEMEREIIMQLRKTEREAGDKLPWLVDTFRRMSEGAIAEERERRDTGDPGDEDGEPEENRPDTE